MKKFLISIFIIIPILFAIFFFVKSSNKNNNPNSSNISQVNSVSNSANYISSNNIYNNKVENKNTTKNVVKNNGENKSNNEKLASFSTNLATTKGNRYSNIKLTVSKLNETIIAPNETFSFNEIVGKPTSEKGYKEADVFVHGEKTKALGGGNCQVSTTIYNLATQVSEIEIVEKHEHSKEVPYIEKGKDAAVSYGQLDLKFKNLRATPIKLIIEIVDSKIVATFYSI